MNLLVLECDICGAKSEPAKNARPGWGRMTPIVIPATIGQMSWRPFSRRPGSGGIDSDDFVDLCPTCCGVLFVFLHPLTRALPGSSQAPLTVGPMKAQAALLGEGVSQDEWERQAASLSAEFRRLFNDARPLLVKLHERVVAAKTLEQMEPQR